MVIWPITAETFSQNRLFFHSSHCGWKQLGCHQCFQLSFSQSDERKNHGTAFVLVGLLEMLDQINFIKLNSQEVECFQFQATSSEMFPDD